MTDFLAEPVEQRIEAKYDLTLQSRNRGLCEKKELEGKNAANCLVKFKSGSPNPNSHT